MFSGDEQIRIRSTRPYSELKDEIKELLRDLGRVYLSRNGDIDIEMTRHASFAWEVKVEGYVEQRKDPDQYRIVLGYKLNPTPGGLVLAFLFFFPVGLILLFMAMSAQQEIKKHITDALDDIEDQLHER